LLTFTVKLKPFDALSDVGCRIDVVEFGAAHPINPARKRIASSEEGIIAFFTVLIR